jgi:transposase
MHRFIQGADRAQASLLPASLQDYVDADNRVRVIEAFVDALDLDHLGFAVIPASTGRPGYHPAMLLKLYVYGYLNRVQSSRRLERECQRNIELMWLTGRLAPDHKTIADFRPTTVRRSARPVRSSSSSAAISACSPGRWRRSMAASSKA